MKRNRRTLAPSNTAVAPRKDGAYENVFLAVGTKQDRSARTRPSLGGMALSQADLDSLYTKDGLAGRIVDAPAEECMRAGFRIDGADDAAVQAGLETLSVAPLFANALRWSWLYGGAVIVMLVKDGSTLEQPLNEEAVQEVESLRVYDRYEVTRHRRYEDPLSPKFGDTEVYQVSPAIGSPYLVHESRCLLFDGLPVPNRTREQNDGWGGSMIQRCYDQLVRANMSHVWGNALLERAQQAVHGIPNLTGLLGQPGGIDLVRKRIDLVDMARSVNNTVVIDSAESYDLKSSSFAGVTDIMDRLGRALAAASGIPEAVLFGRQQSGLGNSGQSELEHWHATIGQQQEVRVMPNLDRLVTLLLRAAGDATEDYTICANPLSVPNAKEQSETDLNAAKEIEIYTNLQAVDPSEIRQHLANTGKYGLDPDNLGLEDRETGPLEPEPAVMPGEPTDKAGAPADKTDPAKE